MDNAKPAASPPPAHPVDQVLGISTCEHCKTRFRLFPKHTRLLNKVIRCPKCHREFTLTLEHPSKVEEAAIRNADEQKQSRIRRTKNEIRGEHIRRIKKVFRTFHKRLIAIASQDSSSEEEVRRWCIDVLREGLGYEDGEIDTEMRALNQRIDIALKQEGKVFLVIECKNIRSKLGSNVRDQAVVYAANKGADWALITNGQIWKLYRVFPVKGADPQTVEVFDLALLDEDGVSDDDAETLFLLTSRALFGGDTEKTYHRISALSQQRILKALVADRVVKALRREILESYQKDAGQRIRLDNETIIDRIQELFLPANL